MKILIIENDPATVESISLTFQTRCPRDSLVSAYLGREGIELAGSEDPDIIILDLGLPDVSGFEVLKQIRLFSSVPIVVLTVRADETNIFQGLELGADDYITKPFSPLELLTRVKARLRDRKHFAEESPISFGSRHFDPLTSQLSYGEKEIKLTAVEAHIIHHLMRNPGHAVTYSSLAQEVWGEDYPGSVDSLSVHIRRIRGKLEANPSHPQIVLTEPGVGYSLAKPSAITNQQTYTQMSNTSKKDVAKKSKLQYLAAALGWVYTGLLFGLSLGAVFSPGHRLLLDFNKFNELWFDVGVFAFAFGLMTWFSFFKLSKRRRTDK